MLEWFSLQLKELAASPLVNLRLYSTCSSSPSINTTTPPSRPDSFQEKIGPRTPIDSPTSTKNSGEVYNVAKQPNFPIYSTNLAVQLQSGRPDISATISDIFERSEANDRVIVAACGPDSLMQAARRSVANNIKVKGPSMEYHAEQFGW